MIRRRGRRYRRRRGYLDTISPQVNSKLYDASSNGTLRKEQCVANKKRICYALFVVLRTCTVAIKDIRDVEHSTEVTAETLYEAIATAIATLQQDNWVGEIGQGFTTVTVVVQQPPVKHEVKMKDFVSWLGRQGRSPAEVMLKQKLEKILVTRGRDRKG